MIYGNISTLALCAGAALATTSLGKPNIRFHQIMMVITMMIMTVMVKRMKVVGKTQL